VSLRRTRNTGLQIGPGEDRKDCWKKGGKRTESVPDSKSLRDAVGKGGSRRGELEFKEKLNTGSTGQGVKNFEGKEGGTECN